MLTQARSEDLVVGEKLHFDSGEGLYRVEALVEVVKEPTEHNAFSVVKIIEIKRRGAALSIRTFAAGTEVDARLKELFVETPDADK